MMVIYLGEGIDSTMVSTRMERIIAMAINTITIRFISILLVLPESGFLAIEGKTHQTCICYGDAVPII